MPEPGSCTQTQPLVSGADRAVSTLREDPGSHQRLSTGEPRLKQFRSLYETMQEENQLQQEAESSIKTDIGRYELNIRE